MKNLFLETEKLQAKDHTILNPGWGHVLDSIAKLAALICDKPIAIVTLTDGQRHWIESKAGLPASELSEESLFIKHTLSSQGILEISDIAEDGRFSGTQPVIGATSVRFYGGISLINSKGVRLGALCVLDTSPGSLTEKQKEALQELAAGAAAHLEADKENRELRLLLEKSKQFQNLFNNSSELHCILRQDGKIEFINQAVKDILEYSPEEVLGHYLHEYWLPEDLDKHFPEILDRVARGDKHYEFEVRIVTGTGKVKWMSFSDLMEDGMILVNGRDITNQKRIQQALEQLSLVASNVNSGVAINDENNTIIWVNFAFEKITGYSLEEVRGKQVGDILKGGDTDISTLDYARERTRKGKDFSVDLLSYRKDGTPVWLSVRNSVVLKPNGKLDKSIEIITDITREKRSELEMQTLSLAVRKSSVGVLIRDGLNKVLWMNKALEKCLGYSLEELKGATIGTMFVGPETDQKLLTYALERFESQLPYEVENVFYRKDGTPVWMYISNTPIVNKDGRIERQISIVMDISERKKAEQQLNKTREETIQLSNAKEAFISALSHEIRSPLNAVIGISDILLEDRPSPHQVENLSLLKFSADNLLTLINDVLDFTKIETGNVALESAAFHLKDLIGNTIESLKFRVAGKPVELKSELDPKIPDYIMGDRMRLYQILMNLLGNAIKFTGKGEVKLAVGLLEESEESVRLKFEVSDTGIGIHPDKISEIFEPYKQASSDITRKYGGTGLGLAITKRLVELHGAVIIVKSKVGRGTTFGFSPRFKKVKDQEETVSGSETTISLPSSVLVVDDNSINRLIAGRLLKNWDIEADFAENGLQALEKLDTRTYDLVLMDIHMPVMDGIEAVKKIREQSDKFKHLPIIALTASVGADDLKRFKEMGMNGFILKPFAPRDLLKGIRSFLDKDNSSFL